MRIIFKDYFNRDIIAMWEHCIAVPHRDDGVMINDEEYRVIVISYRNPLEILIIVRNVKTY